MSAATAPVAESTFLAEQVNSRCPCTAAACSTAAFHRHEEEDRAEAQCAQWKHVARCRRRARAPSMERRTIVGRFSRILTVAGSYGDGLFHFILVPPLLPRHAIISSADTGNAIWRLEIKRRGVKLSLRCQTPSVAATRRRYGSDLETPEKHLADLLFHRLIPKSSLTWIKLGFCCHSCLDTLKSNQTADYFLKK